MIRSMSTCGVLLTIFMLLVSSVAHADFVLDRTLPFPSGEDNVIALGYGDDGFLWIHGRSTEKVYRLQPATGAVLQSFAAVPSSTVTSFHDIDVHGGILYALGEPAIQRFNTATGAELAPLTGPVTGGARGLTVLNGDLYVSGVLAGFPGVVRVGRVDRTTGALKSSVAAPDLIDTHGLGNIGGGLGYLIEPDPPYEQADVILNIIEPNSGGAIDSQVLFNADYTMWALDASATELFVARRNLGVIEVYVPEPSTLVCVILGISLLGWRRRRRCSAAE